MKSFSLDLRRRIVEACEAGGETQRAIGARFDVSYSFVLKLWFQWRHTGSLEPLKRSGRRPAFDARALHRLKRAVHEEPDATLEELRDACGVVCSLVTVHNTLNREGFRRKKTLRADEQKRPDIRSRRGWWRRKARDISPEHFVFIDESGAKTNMARLYGRTLGGQRLFAHAPGGHWYTTTMIAALRISGPTAPMVIRGPVDTDVFRAYTSEVLVPTLHPGDIVVLDNLSSHKASDIRERIENVGARLWYLPPYSPDFNPIEMMWSKVKADLRHAAARTEETLFEAVAHALKTITPKNAENWFRHCQYLYVNT